MSNQNNNVNPNLTVEICTKDRYFALSHTLQSISTQSLLPSKIIIFDDSKNKYDLRQDSFYLNLFKLFDRKGIKWGVEFSDCHGQVKNHIKATQICETSLLYRCDDDHVLENNVLGSLCNLINKDDKIGAVTNTILHPELDFPEDCTSACMEDVCFKYAANFAKFNGLKEVQHIYSSFLCRNKAIQNCYPTNLSEVGHREESICTYNLYKSGYKMFCIGDVFTWHMKSPTGGIRTHNNPAPWNHDEELFQKQIKDWKLNVNNYFLMINSGGIGDNFSMRHIIPEIKNKHPNKKIIIGTVYADFYFDDPSIETISVHGANILARGGHEKFDVYKYCWHNSHVASMVDAYRKVYLN